MTLTISEAVIISTMMEALLYGFSFPVYILILWVHIQSRKALLNRPNHWFIGLASVLQVLAGVGLAINIVRVWQGLIGTGPSLLGGSETYFLDVSHHTFIIKSILCALQTLILNGVIIYRTYVVWKSVYLVVLPALGWVGLLAASIGANVVFAKTTGSSFEERANEWATAVHALTLATNLPASLLLAYRTWAVNREALRYRSSSHLKPILRAVMESGAIYTTTITIALILFVINSVEVYVLLDMISPIICITFHIITIRIAFPSDGISDIINNSIGNVRTTIHSPRNSHTANLPHTSFGLGFDYGYAPTSLNVDATPRVRAYTPDGHQLRSLAIQITQHIETDADGSSIVDVGHKPQGRLA